MIFRSSPWRIPVLPATLVVLLSLSFALRSGRSMGQTLPPGFTDALVVGGFSQPVGFTFDANGRMYVWERGGKVWIVENGVKLPTPLIDITEEVGNWGDFGLLGFALDPAFLSNGRFYLSYVVDRYYLLNYGLPGYDQFASSPSTATIMRITRYSAPGPTHNVADAGSRFVLFGESFATGAAVTHGSHGNGTLLFGEDGTLIASLGDGASYNVVDVGSSGDTRFLQCLDDGSLTTKTNVGAMRAQMIDSPNGKVLRLDPNTGDGVPSNPWYDPAAPRAPRSRVWELGVRNAYRITLRPGSGSTDPADGDPGTLYIGDVGWQNWEELNVCTGGGENLGWPIYEGMDQQPGYAAALTANMDAPNPLFGQGGCAQQFFNFQELLHQDSESHINGHPNPCDALQQVPPNISTFFHHRPALDFKHANQSRCAGFENGLPVTYDLDAPNSPVPGPRFGGFASIGGTWIDGVGWPVGYQSVYFHADYAMSWIRRMEFNDEDELVSVADFGSNMGAVVCMQQGPDGGLWYVKYNTNEVRKINPVGITNLPPVASATQNLLYGTGPLQVSFNATGSSDPENGPLTYAWNFGDSGTGSGATVQHTFTAPANTPTSYTVTLTVTDDHAQTSTFNLLVSVNNTPPTATITSIPIGFQYPVGVDSTLTLDATVSDAQSPPSQLTRVWQNIFHHNTHIHPGPELVAHDTVTTLYGEGCYEETFFYEIVLTVTDPHGLSTTVTQNVYPRCSAVAPTAVIISDKDLGQGPFSALLSGASSVDNGTITSYVWDLGDGTSATGPTVNKTFTEPGDHNVRLTVTDNDGNTGTAVKVINVLEFDPPQCVGTAGTLLRQYWSNIAGANVVDLTSSSSFPNNPSGSSAITSFSGPVNFGNDYGTRVRGYIIAPESGVYHFTVTSDGASVLYLSPNAEPKYKQAICSVPTFTAQGEYTKFTTQRSAAITLQQGVYYYVELVHKESTGSDHFTVNWERPSVPAITLIPGANLAAWQDCGPSLRARVDLQGAFDANAKWMRDDLRANGLLPLTEPFTALGFTQVGGGGGETIQATLLNVTGKNAIVDWVLLEVRDNATPTTILATKAALVQRDGDIVGTDGRARILLNVTPGLHHVAVRHRNHLGAMSALPRTFGASETGFDLTLPGTSTYGTQAQVALNTAVMGLWSGNALRDTKVKYTGNNNDRDPILAGIGGTVPTNVVSGYSLLDVNLDGLIKYTGTNNDRDPILVNIGGTVPTNVRHEQLP